MNPTVPTSVFPSSVADGARPSTGPATVDDVLVKQVVGMLMGVRGLEVRQHAIRAAMHAAPAGQDHVAAAEEVGRWVETGVARSREAGVLLAAALKAQRHQAFSRALRWAEQALPDESAPLAASAALVVRASGRTVTKAAVMDRLRAQGRDKASLTEAVPA